MKTRAPSAAEWSAAATGLRPLVGLCESVAVDDGARDMNVEGNDQLAGLRPVRAYALRTEEWGGIHPARRLQPAQAGLKPRRGLKAAPHSCRAPVDELALDKSAGFSYTFCKTSIFQRRRACGGAALGRLPLTVGLPGTGTLARRLVVCPGGCVGALA